ncbi:AraC family transcriptional regulator [Nostoc sp. FACHB-110]|uniref:helix-turn-helix domain-containing protein n=1 Tax=Nostoc sp. FACHB-110 TaxID=2692834 RepID=UPI00168924D4|nr:AraC family transcriptional regulator [Nostoc sp. FACHB-110]MBD2438980.1 helix-turn-helix transcriptional regulator [Nostoc sp. FACHB-110]
MRDIFLINAETETQNLLINCLKNSGFEVVGTENGLVNVKVSNDTLSPNHDINKSYVSLTSIFPSIPRLREVFDFIELNYCQNIKLKEVAQAVGYSPAYLTDLVRRLTGKTVNNWIIERRLIQATTLLSDTNYSIEEIALKVGYQNINHFYCQFRDYYKITPRTWREQQRCQVSYTNLI